ncbi:MAG: HPr family phosphocarrier protein [Oscillospiraceae bacterium]|nr:HPr family phosphocarrier protein [Oscillospiraceae bacterium]MCI9394616.1 HPr family phosphocarrier protein [Oscillospiraceae bacterium]
MEAVTISLTQVNQVQKFVNVVSKVPYDVDMVSGRYTINAKSLLGIYSLDLNRPLQVVMYSDDCEALKKELEEFMR